MRSGDDPGDEEGGHVYSRECCVGELCNKHHCLRVCATKTTEVALLNRQGAAALLLEWD